MDKRITSLFSLSAMTLAAVMFVPQAGFAGALPTFEEADIDGDGRLSKAEADAAFEGFEIPDLNHDGFVSKYEVKLVLPDVAFKKDDLGSVGTMEFRMILQALERQDQRLRELAARAVTSPGGMDAN